MAKTVDARSGDGLSRGNLVKALLGFILVAAVLVGALAAIGYAVFAVKERHFESDQVVESETVVPDQAAQPKLESGSSTPVPDSTSAAPSVLPAGTGEKSASDGASRQPDKDESTVLSAAEPPTADAVTADGGAAEGHITPAEPVSPGVSPASPEIGEVRARLIGDDSDSALADLQAIAESGNAEAQLLLGELYRDGRHVDADPPLALAWLMHAAARGFPGADVARNALYESLDDTARVQGESKSRSLKLPMPPGWIYSKDGKVKVWGPSWYRNGTWDISFAVESRDGLAHGTGRIDFKALLYGRSSRSYEGAFNGGYLLGDKLVGRQFDFLPTDEYRVHVEPDATTPGVTGIWRQNEMSGLKLTACGRHHLALYAVLDRSVSVLDDDALRAIAIAVTQRTISLCPLDPRSGTNVTLLPADYRPVFDRGDTEYEPKVAELYLDTGGEAPSQWHVSLTNFAKRRHEQAEREAARARKTAARQRQKEKELAAARSRAIPTVRGLTLGMSHAEVVRVLGDDIVHRKPPALPTRGLPQHEQFSQALTLSDKSQITITFASGLNGHGLVGITLEQTLRNGPAADAARSQFIERFGPPDTSTGGDTWLTWWLTSSTGKVKGALLRARLRVHGGKLDSYWLVLADTSLQRKDEQEARAAKRAAKNKAATDALEQKKSDQVSF